MGRQEAVGRLKGEADFGPVGAAGVSVAKGETVAPAAAMASGLKGERVPVGAGLAASSASAFSR
jgi:hypothetical protein